MVCLALVDLDLRVDLEVFRDEAQFLRTCHLFVVVLWLRLCLDVLESVRLQGLDLWMGEAGCRLAVVMLNDAGGWYNYLLDARLVERRDWTEKADGSCY